MNGVLFDVDGTLVDSSYLHALAWWRALREAGEDFPMTAVHHLIGMGADQFTQTLLGHEDGQLAQRHDAQMERLRPEIRRFAGVPELLRAVKARGCSVVLATSAGEDELAGLLSAISASDAIDEVTSAADAGASKPAPDIFLAAMRKAGLDRAMVVGDSIWDIRAARTAGLPCIGVETGGVSRLELTAEGAAAVYRDPHQLLEQLDSSPLAALWR